MFNDGGWTREETEPFMWKVVDAEPPKKKVVYDWMSNLEFFISMYVGLYESNS